MQDYRDVLYSLLPEGVDSVESGASNQAEDDSDDDNQLHPTAVQEAMNDIKVFCILMYEFTCLELNRPVNTRSYLAVQVTLHTYT